MIPELWPIRKPNSEKLKLAWANFKDRGSKISEKFLDSLEAEFDQYSLGALLIRSLREKAPVMKKAKPKTQSEKLAEVLRQRDLNPPKPQEKSKNKSKSCKKDRGMEM